ncbi:MAG: hypothetical protein RL758_114 [Pseudomonadota bacterium]|jgi:hypothetical protein
MLEQIVVAEIDGYDPAIYGTRTLRFSTQGFATAGAPLGDPTLDSRFTVIRAGEATRINRLGLIETVASNTPRFDYNPTTKSINGLLIEESRTNVLLNSLLNGNNLATQNVTVTATAYTLSFYGAGTVTMSGAFSGSLVGLGAYPTRSTLTFTPTAGTLTLTVTGTVQFANLEAGLSATSFIPTAGAAVTRNVDSIVMSGSNFTPWYNSAEGTLFAEWQQGTTDVVIPVGITDGTVNNRLTIVGGTTIGGRITVAGVSTNPAAVTGGVGVHRSAMALKSGDSAQYTNGVLNSAVTPSGVPTVNRMELGGQPATSSAYLNGWLRRVMYWPTRLTNTQLQQLTTGQLVPSGMRMELDLTGGANAYYEARIKVPPSVQRECFQNARTFGRSQIGYGETTLVNNDGGLDYMLGYSYSGRRIVIRLGTLQNDQLTYAWSTILVGSMEQVELSWQEVAVRIRDRLLDLATPLQQVRYAGGNVLPAGLEGNDDDLKGRPKPLVYGQVFNISPPCVNTTRFIYQIHTGGQVVSVNGVYDRGALLTAGAAYSSQADMEANSPSANQYRVWNDATLGCFIRLGSNPTGTVTADVTQGATRTVGQLFQAILLKAGVLSSQINSSDIAALDAAVSYQVGVYAGSNSDVTPLELLDELCASVGAWYGTDINGNFRIGRIVLPTGTSLGTITTVEIIQIERIASRDAGVGVPSWKVKLGWQKMQTVQPDLNTSVSVARKTLVAEEYRRQEVSDATVKTANLLSPEIEFPTVLVNKGDAANEAARRLAIYKERRDIYKLTVRVDAQLASILDLGNIVTLQINRFGMNAGKKFLIIGVKSNMRGYLFELTLWG